MVTREWQYFVIFILHWPICILVSCCARRPSGHFTTLAQIYRFIIIIICKVFFNFIFVDCGLTTGTAKLYKLLLCFVTVQLRGADQ